MPVHRIVLGAILAGVAHALLNYTFPASSCISPPDFNSCSQQVNEQFVTCSNNAGGDTDQVAACADAANEFILNCAYESCWNIIYGCDVQELASLVVQNDGSAGFPYYPAPDGAPGGCSCNLERVQLVVDYSIGNAYNSCISANSNSIDQISSCGCCAQAGAYAGIYSVCPSVDPALLLQSLPGTDSLLDTYDPQFSDCSSILSQTNCESALSFPTLGYSLTYLSALPATTGTASWTDLPGQLSAPSASILTYTAGAGGVVLTATAVDVGAGGSAAPGESGGASMAATVGSSAAATSATTSADSGSTGGSSTTTAATAASSSKKSSASSINESTRCGILFALAVAISLLGQ